MTSDGRAVVQLLLRELSIRHFPGPHGDCPACAAIATAKEYLRELDELEHQLNVCAEGRQ